MIDLDSVGLGYSYWDIGSLISWSDLDVHEINALLEGYGVSDASDAYKEIMLFKDIADLFEYYVNLKHDKLFNQLMTVKYANRLITRYGSMNE
ncbi:MAG: hypothetical protein OXE99_14955 [Cellvibrionales bacterium]|nr:hypothetical protein [Cellvibrionales bacterium]